MGGKVLDYEAKTIYMNGKNDGIVLGMDKAWNRAWRKA